MSLWKKYAMIAAAAFVLICLMTVGLLVPGEGVTRLIAVFALLVAAVKTIYDIWKKERETKELVKATPAFREYDTAEIVGVELYNAGTSPMAIKRVALVVKTDTGKLSEFMPSESEAVRLENCYFQEASTLPESVSRFELGPKKHARFHLDRHTELTIDWLLKQPADTFCIVVESFMGEVARVLGKDIQAAIVSTPYGKAIKTVEKNLSEMSSANTSCPFTPNGDEGGARHFAGHLPGDSGSEAHSG
jgi:hypothetical protein